MQNFKLINNAKKKSSTPVEILPGSIWVIVSSESERWGEGGWEERMTVGLDERGERRDINGSGKGEGEGGNWLYMCWIGGPMHAVERSLSYRDVSKSS